MTKKREPIDLVGRLSSRLSLTSQGPVANEAPSPFALRAAAAPKHVVSSTPEPRIVGRDAPRVEPTFRPARTGRAHWTKPVPPMTPLTGRGPAGPGPCIETPMDEDTAPAVIAEVPMVEIAPDEIDVSAPMAGDAAVAPAETVSEALSPHGDEASVIMVPTADEPTESSATDAVDREVAPGRKYVELNLVRLHKEGFLTPHNQRSLIAEEYRIIKRPLLRAAFDHVNEPGNLNHVAMITSARPDEGKTFTAVNLAMSVATERDLFVLLVDCDIRRMGLSKKLGVSDRKGLMDVLMDPSLSIADVILRTNIPNLAIVPSGQPVEAATEVFASAKMTTLVDDLASRYPDRFIIFDAPPVLASSEPGVLAVHVGQTVMVVHANETSKRAIAQSIPLINSCPNVHFVLNRVTLAAGPDRFGYYGTY